MTPRLCRLLAWLALCLGLCAADARAQAEAQAARVLFYGDFAGAKSQAEFAVTPGSRFGLELVPEGGQADLPVVLDVRVKRPGDPEDAPPISWEVAARMGQPVRCVYEFAYEWEIRQGVWIMAVYSGDTLLAGASFGLTKGQALQDKQAQKDKPAAKAQDAKPASRQPARAADQASPKAPEPARDKPAPEPKDKGAGPQGQAPAQPQGAAKAQPSASVQPHVQPHVQPQAPQQAGAPRALGGAPGRRVFAVMGGTFSEEGRALWMAALLKGQGASPCVRETLLSGKKAWGVVLGWSDELELAKRLRDDMARIAKDVAIIPTTAADLAKGMVCR